MHLGRSLILIGGVIALTGLLLVLLEKTPFRLPGTVTLYTKNSTFIFPLGACIVLSLLLTLILSIFRK
jgi:hypothetical protein